MRKLGPARNTRLKKNDFKIELSSHVAREVGAVIYLGLSILFFLIIAGNAGMLGDFVNKYLRLIFGVGTLALPWVFLGLSATLFFYRTVALNATKYFGIALLLISGLGLVHMDTDPEMMLENVQAHGGYMGFLASVLLRIFLQDIGATVVLSVIFVIGFLLTFDLSIKKMVAFLWTRSEERMVGAGMGMSMKGNLPRLKAPKDELNIVKPQISRASKAKDEDAPDKKEPAPEPMKVKEMKLAINKPAPVKKSEIQIEEKDYADWELPSLELLSSDSSEMFVDDKTLKEHAEKIRNKLAQFDIPVVMKDVNIGPTVMQYTLQPAEGIKVAKITGLKDDLAMALAAKSIRIEAPIPGKALVGIEVPNDKRMVVHLREILESEEFSSINSKLKLAIGRDVSGTPVIDDLATMPHLLIAGATGSGKSVGMNTFLLSLLFQNSPQELKFIMVDPKRVELTTYNGIPHLLTPVITQPEKAHAALKWAVSEMNRRYQEYAEKGYRNIDEYNAHETKKMAKIVIVIDELADLMMQANKKETEALICRIAQMARAVGMHLILATQRPSVDVITGLIKANIPTRIAFTVTSGVDSRTIIDSVGAEDLLGMGDMLYMPGNMTRHIRVQGIYVSSKEIQRVTNRVKLTVEPTYDDKITEGGTAPGASSINLDAVGSSEEGMAQDDLFNDAVQVVKESKKASASLLQRRMNVGYARAARLLDIMEEQGLIGPVNGAKAREIYISDEGGSSEGEASGAPESEENL